MNLWILLAVVIAALVLLLLELLNIEKNLRAFIQLSLPSTNLKTSTVYYRVNEQRHCRFRDANQRHIFTQGELMWFMRDLDKQRADYNSKIQEELQDMVEAVHSKWKYSDEHDDTFNLERARKCVADMDRDYIKGNYNPIPDYVGGCYERIIQYRQCIEEIDGISEPLPVDHNGHCMKSNY